MRVLWFEVTEPSSYKTGGTPIAGWQDSLERIIKTEQSIELIVAFISDTRSDIKIIDNVTYIPIYKEWTFLERISSKYWDIYISKILPEALKIVENYKPDLIHVFGTEWHFGQLAGLISTPIVIHIMGSIVPYNNAAYPPMYSFESQVLSNIYNPLKIYKLWKSEQYKKNWEKWERSTWRLVKNYMGRTHWDRSLSRIMHPNCCYFHVDEALRDIFIVGEREWTLPVEKKIKLVSTGCSTFWKGPDMMLKVAYILKSLNVDFEWFVIGKMNQNIKKWVENREGYTFEECNLKILGFKQPAELVNILCSSTIYVHTAYIENSPNSICEAQCLGVPIVSTNVGGISTLIRDGIDGDLIAANDPWKMADAIIQLAADTQRMQQYSSNSKAFALKRHNDESIKEQILNCYNALLI